MCNVDVIWEKGEYSCCQLFGLARLLSAIHHSSSTEMWFGNERREKVEGRSILHSFCRLPTADTKCNDVMMWWKLTAGEKWIFSTRLKRAWSTIGIELSAISGSVADGRCATCYVLRAIVRIQNSTLRVAGRCVERRRLRTTCYAVGST